MSDAPAILFAPVLRAERWTSIDLQQQNILEALRAHASAPKVSVLRLSEALVGLPFGKQLLRDFAYPRAIRKTARALGRCVLHVSDHSYGHLSAAHRPSVVNCNDLHHLVQPDLDAGYLRRWRQRVEGLRNADKVIAISAHLAGEVREHLGIAGDRIAVLHGGVDTAVFRTSPLEEAATLLPQVAALRGTHQLVLNIGANVRRKNLPTLLRAVRVLVHDEKRPVKLLKAGPRLRDSEHEPLIRELGIADAIVDLGHLPPTGVAAACRLAHALSFPTLYEGFGRPTVEAQACGLPCVLADASCLREIGGNGAAYHAPMAHEELAAALGRIFDDAAVRERLIAAGLANAARFSWSAYAERLVAIYREVAQ